MDLTLTPGQLEALKGVLRFIYDIGLPDSMEKTQSEFDQLYDKVMGADSHTLFN
jgi:hypothetical protein